MRSTSIFSGDGVGFGRSTTPSSSTQTKEQADSTSQATLHIKDQNTLELTWRKVAIHLQAIDKVVATRMESIIPRLKSENEIEIEVANQNVETFFRENKSIILEGFKREFGDGQLNIVFKQSENLGPQKILSTYEQLEEMSKINPSLKKLRDTLELIMK